MLLLSICVFFAIATGRPGAPPGSPPAVHDSALVTELLGRVTTVPRRIHVLGYDRGLFGDWMKQVTPDGSLCTTREAVLLSVFGSPASSPGLGPACPSVSGTITDLYSGAAVTPDEIEVDHVFPLAAAWDHGAHGWTRQTRISFANDRQHNLLAVSAGQNRSKSDGTPAEWLPDVDAAGRCAYVARYLTVAVTYRLSISDADAESIRQACRH